MHVKFLECRKLADEIKLFCVDRWLVVVVDVDETSGLECPFKSDTLLIDLLP